MGNTTNQTHMASNSNNNDQKQNISLATKTFALSPVSNNKIKIPVYIQGNWNIGDKFNCNITIDAVYDEKETISNIIDVIIKYMKTKHSPINLQIYSIKHDSFTQSTVWFDRNNYFVTLKTPITHYQKHKVNSKGLHVKMMVNYQYKVHSLDITCKYMKSKNTTNPLICPIYHAMKKNNECSQQRLNHLNQFTHFKSEYIEKPECKYNQYCYSYIRVEKGGNQIADLCHMKLFKHPPREVTIKLSQNIKTLVINTTNKENYCIYKPTDNDKTIHNYNVFNGYLNALVSECISNGFHNDVHSAQKYINLKMNSYRHKIMGSPLNCGEMLSLILYCGYNCNYDLCSNQRNNNYIKWKWFDYLLYNAIFKLSSCESGLFSVYSGLNNVQINNKYINCGFFKTFVSTSWNKKIAQKFMKGDGMIIEFNQSFKNNYQVKCCDVSWISNFPDECEILFARHQGDYWFNNSFKCKVLDNFNGVQNVSLTKQ